MSLRDEVEREIRYELSESPLATDYAFEGEIPADATPEQLLELIVYAIGGMKRALCLLADEVDALR